MGVADEDLRKGRTALGPLAHLGSQIRRGGRVLFLVVDALLFEQLLCPRAKPADLARIDRHIGHRPNLVSFRMTDRSIWPQPGPLARPGPVPGPTLAKTRTSTSRAPARFRALVALCAVAP